MSIFHKDSNIKFKDNILIVEPCPCGKKIGYSETDGTLIVIYLKLRPPNNIFDD